jgi:large subunit ribosomal protein L23
MGKTARRRKAIVTLTADSNDIKIFNDNNDQSDSDKESK